MKTYDVYNPFSPSGTSNPIDIGSSKGMTMDINVNSIKNNFNKHSRTIYNYPSNYPSIFTSRDYNTLKDYAPERLAPISNNVSTIKPIKEDENDFVRKVMVNPKLSCKEDFKEKVNHPSHYNTKGKETIKVLEDYLSKEEYTGFLKGNILKYIHRYETKNGLEDLNKAKWYLEELIRITSSKRENG